MAHAAFHRIRALDRIREEPPTIDADMRPCDIADALKGLRFASGHAVTIKLADPETRDYLVGCIARQAERSR
jgi:hypothetical protein